MSTLKLLVVVCFLSLLAAPFQSISPSLVFAQESAFVFTRDLESGMTGADVKELQKYLNSEGFLVAPAGEPGSPGNETEKFGAATFAALKKFQAAKGISPASGYFGPITRNFISGNASTIATSASSSGSGSVSVGSSNIPASDYQRLKQELFNEFKALLTKQSDAIVDSSARSTSAVSDSVSSLSDSITTNLNLLSASTSNALSNLQGSITSSQWTTGDDGSISYDGNVTIGATVLDATSGVIVPLALATSTPISPDATGFYLNDNAGAVTYNLPSITTATVGLQMCFRNAVGKSGAITLQLPASTYVDVGGANGTAAGTLVSAGALGDAACVVAQAVGQYIATISSGAWTNN